MFKRENQTATPLTPHDILMYWNEFVSQTNEFYEEEDGTRYTPRTEYEFGQFLCSRSEYT